MSSWLGRHDEVHRCVVVQVEQLHKRVAVVHVDPDDGVFAVRGAPNMRQFHVLRHVNQRVVAGVDLDISAQAREDRAGQLLGPAGLARC